MMEKNKEGYGKADVGKRILAGIIDGLIAFTPILIPIIGAIASVAYILTKDVLPYIVSKKEGWRNRSIGKRLMGLKVVELSGQDIDIAISCKRNVTMGIGSFFAIVPVLGWIIGVLIQLVLWTIEVFLVLTDPKGQRMGDRIANTQVIEA